MMMGLRASTETKAPVITMKRSWRLLNLAVINLATVLCPPLVVVQATLPPCNTAHVIHLATVYPRVALLVILNLATLGHHAARPHLVSVRLVLQRMRQHGQTIVINLATVQRMRIVISGWCHLVRIPPHPHPSHLAVIIEVVQLPPTPTLTHLICT
uniref:Uncharacterized protein n=1 Tax=Cacopsylla melanoneura TaxID=428564 RepID=A0A8D9BU50_9HEMI